MSERKLPPYKSLYLARCALDHKFPHHTKVVKKAGPQEKALLTELREIAGQMRKLALQQAAVEIELKEIIGFNEGIEIPNEGTLFWTSATSPRKSKVNWMKLVQDYGISEEKLREYQRANDGQRRFFFDRHCRSPQGIEHVNRPTKERTEFDDDL